MCCSANFRSSGYFLGNYGIYGSYGNYAIIPIAPIISTAPIIPIALVSGLRPSQTYQLGQRKGGMRKGKVHLPPVGQQGHTVFEIDNNIG